MSDPGLAYELEGVDKVFPGGEVALQGVTLRIARGERVALVGPSGAGKTTLFRLLNLTLRPTRGTLRVLGTDPSALRGRELRALRRRIGTVYQQHNLVGRLRVVHNVLAGRLGGWSTLTALRSLLVPCEVGLAEEALRRVGIPEKLHARTDTLSGGQQQRVAIARVLVQDPEVILADEPVASVDPALARSLVRLLVELSEAGGKTLLMSLHTVELALASFPRLVGVADGRVCFDLPPDRVTRELLGELYAGVPADATTPEPAGAVGGACRPLAVR